MGEHRRSRPRALATLSDAISQDVAAFLGARTRRQERRPPDPRAYELFEHGRSFLLRDESPAARELFKQAVRRDSTFALGGAGLANA